VIVSKLRLVVSVAVSIHLSGRRGQYITVRDRFIIQFAVGVSGLSLDQSRFIAGIDGGP